MPKIIDIDQYLLKLFENIVGIRFLTALYMCTDCAAMSGPPDVDVTHEQPTNVTASAGNSGDLLTSLITYIC